MPVCQVALAHSCANASPGLQERAAGALWGLSVSEANRSVKLLDFLVQMLDWYIYFVIGIRLREPISAFINLCEDLCTGNLPTASMNHIRLNGYHNFFFLIKLQLFIFVCQVVCFLCYFILVFR